jgi:hypothetical protein
VDADGEEVVTVKTEEIYKGSADELSFLNVFKILLVVGGNIITPWFHYFYNMINTTCIVCSHGASESALCESSYDPYLSHNTSTSSTTSKQCISEVLGNSDNAEICAFEGTSKSNLVDSLSNQDAESHHLNNGFSDLSSDEDVEYEEVARNSTAHKQSVMSSILNNEKKTIYPSWVDRFQELVDFKAINGHANVSQKSGPIRTWVKAQRIQYRLLKEGNNSPLTSDRRQKLERIGFTFKCRPSPTITPWDERFQALVDFKKTNGHANVPQRSGPLGTWVKDTSEKHSVYSKNVTILNIDH